MGIVTLCQEYGRNMMTLVFSGFRTTETVFLSAMETVFFSATPNFGYFKSCALINFVVGRLDEI